MPNQGIQVGEYTKEINRYEERLIAIRHEVEELGRVRHKSQEEVADVLKHLEFLKIEDTTRGTELEKKRTIISGLDAQIADKQGQLDKLQAEVSSASKALATAIAEKEEAEARTIEHGKILRDEHQKLDDRRRLTEQNHEISAAKLQKIQEFIKNLN